MKQALRSLRNNFIVGFVAILPLALSLYIFLQLVSFVVGITDKLLVFLPPQLHESAWRMDPITNTRTPAPLFRFLAFLISMGCVTLLGFIARNVLGKSLLSGLESLALRVPLLNKIYGGTKQIIEAIGASKKGVFQRVVLVRFPYRDSFSIGFVTSEAKGEIQTRTEDEVINVFVPTTPNPTSGFLLLIPKREIIPLEMSVADAIKMVISGGAMVPPSNPPAISPAKPVPAPDGNP
jgi:uncharacterized membrane protein